MGMLAHFKSVIRQKSGREPVLHGLDSLRTTMGYDISHMRKNGFDPRIIAEHEAFNDRLETALSHPELCEYLCTLTPEEIYLASGVRVLTVGAIKEEIQDLAPNSLLFRCGYFPFATSIGGNAVSFHISTGNIVWADHDSFGEEEISFKNRVTKEWEYLPLSPENIGKALAPLAGDLGKFLPDLLNDKLEKQLDELD